MDKSKAWFVLVGVLVLPLLLYAGGKPSKGTKPDKRLKENKPAQAKKPFKGAAPPFKKDGK